MFRFRRYLDIGVYITILMTIEIALWYFPNVQLTFFLFLVLFKRTNFKEGLFGIWLYVILKILVWGFSIYSLTPLLIYVIMMIAVKKIDNIHGLIIVGILFAPYFGLMYGLFHVALTQTPLLPYLTRDVIFWVPMAFSNVLSLIWLYDGFTQFLNKQKILGGSFL